MYLYIYHLTYMNDSIYLSICCLYMFIYLLFYIDFICIQSIIYQLADRYYYLYKFISLFSIFIILLLFIKLMYLSLFIYSYVMFSFTSITSYGISFNYSLRWCQKCIFLYRKVWESMRKYGKVWESVWFCCLCISHFFCHI